MAMNSISILQQRPVHWTNDRSVFFKYLSLKTATVVLEGGRLRWSTPGKLNDPYDMQFDLHVDVDRNKVRTASLAKLWEAHYGEKPLLAKNQMGAFIQSTRSIFPKLTREKFDAEFGPAIDEGLAALERVLPETQAEVRRKIGMGKILCLSGIPDNILMWSHYAESHQGIVLRLKPIPELDSPWGVALPVVYRTDMPRLLDEYFLAEMTAGLVSISPASVIQRMVYTKSAEWEYEQEWRIFAGTGRDAQAPYEDIRFHPRELDAVIFGCNIPKNDREAVSKIVHSKYPHAQILEAFKSNKKFQIEIRPVSIS